MKLLFDQNLSYKLVGEFSQEFPGSAHVRDLGFATASDADIWNYAKENEFVIVSKDNDCQQRALLFGHPPKVIWLRIGNCTTATIVRILRARLADIEAFDADSMASFLVLSSANWPG